MLSSKSSLHNSDHQSTRFSSKCHMLRIIVRNLGHGVSTVGPEVMSGEKQFRKILLFCLAASGCHLEEDLHCFSSWHNLSQ